MSVRTKAVGREVGRGSRGRMRVRRRPELVLVGRERRGEKVVHWEAKPAPSRVLVSGEKEGVRVADGGLRTEGADPGGRRRSRFGRLGRG